jgi:glycosyltransferase involved in cell wall biosynthesis
VHPGYQSPAVNVADPVVSVIIPIKDRARLFLQSTRSIIDQRFSAWEALVIDDGSTAHEATLIKQATGGDPRFRFFNRAGLPSGASACRNLGIARARGRFIMFLDSDDLLAPHCLEQRVAALDARKEVGFLVFATEVFKERQGDYARYWNVWNDRPDLDRFLAIDPPWQTSGPIWRRDALARIGPWDQDAPGWQDWEYHIRALALDIPYAKVEQCDNFWRYLRKDSLSVVSQSQDLHLARADLVVRVIKHLRECGKLSSQRKGLLFGILYGIALWNPGRQSSVTRQILARIWQCRLVPVPQWSLFCACALASRYTPGIRIGEALLRRFYRDAPRPFESSTFLRATSIRDS